MWWPRHRNLYGNPQYIRPFHAFYKTLVNVPLVHRVNMIIARSTWSRPFSYLLWWIV